MKNMNSFLSTFYLYDSNIKKFRYRLSNHKFEIYEQRLLNSLELYHKNKSIECLDLLNSFKGNNHLIEGLRLYMIGLCHNQQSQFDQAQSSLESSVILLEHTKEKRLLFFAYSVLIINLTNKRDKTGVKKTLTKLKKIPATTNAQVLQFNQCMLCYYLLYEKSNEALEFIKEVYLTHKRLGSHRPYYLVLEFMFTFMNKDHDRCYEILESYKKVRGNKVTANYTFMKSMLDHITHNTPLYVYKKDYKDDMGLYKQAMLIKHLSCGELDQAQSFWNDLKKASPLVYDENYTFNGGYNLFSVALKKHSSKLNKNLLNLKELSMFNKVQDKLIYILESTSTPVSKFDLADYLWKDEEYSDSVENRLKKQISRLRKKYPNKISQSQGTYWIEKKAA